MIRNILAALAGLVVGIAVISLIQKISHSVYPFPSDVQWNNPEAARLALQQAPVGALLIVLLGYIVGSYAAGLVAAIIGPLAAKRNAILIGAVLTFTGVVNLVMLPHPGWFWVSVLVYLPFTWLGAKTGMAIKNKNQIV